MKKTLLFFVVALLFCGSVHIQAQGHIFCVDVNSSAVRPDGSFSVLAKSGSRISVWDMQGRCVLETISFDDQTVLQAPKHGGVYFVNIIDETAIPQTVKLIVQ